MILKRGLGGINECAEEDVLDSSFEGKPMDKPAEPGIVVKPSKTRKGHISHQYNTVQKPRLSENELSDKLDEIMMMDRNLLSP